MQTGMFACVVIVIFYILAYFNSGELPNLGDIENVHKKRAHDKETRLATVLVFATIVSASLFLRAVLSFTIK